jgi:hypothetical protein
MIAREICFRFCPGGASSSALGVLVLLSLFVTTSWAQPASSRRVGDFIKKQMQNLHLPGGWPIIAFAGAFTAKLNGGAASSDE